MSVGSVAVGLILGVAYFLYVDKKKKTEKLAKECSYGCPIAYDILKERNNYKTLKESFLDFTSPADRYFYSVSISRTFSLKALKEWVDEEPSSADGLLCYGARVLQWAWEARGYGLGSQVSEKNAQKYFKRLEIARSVLLRCAEKRPTDPTPWAYLIMVSTWSSDKEEVERYYFSQAMKRDPENWAAHMHMIIALSEKWGGSHKKMIEFSEQASANASEGSDIAGIVVKAYIEYWKYLVMFEGDPESAKNYIESDEVKNKVIVAYERSLGSEQHSASKATVFARYNFSGWFWVVRDKARLRSEFDQLGNSIEDIHWRWVSTEGELDSAQLFSRKH